VGVCGGKDAENLIDEGLAHGFDALEVEDHGFELRGPLPRIADTVAVVGCVGSEVSFEQAAFAAKVSTIRALALVKQACGSLDAVICVPRMSVFIRSAADFTQHSEVADAASNLLVAVLGTSSAHSRTSVGVAQLPKGAAVELDFIFRVGHQAGGA
jgi:enamine deaminase RidA (YjgF/YER057c/UK114 family)